MHFSNYVFQSQSFQEYLSCEAQDLIENAQNLMKW